MLPFLSVRKKQNDDAVLIKSDGKMEDTTDKSEEMHGLESAAKDLLKAFESKDISKIASALKAAFEICDSYPHHEGEHIEE